MLSVKGGMLAFMSQKRFARAKEKIIDNLLMIRRRILLISCNI